MVQITLARLQGVERRLPGPFDGLSAWLRR
jgi:hypothetical protein